MKRREFLGYACCAGIAMAAGCTTLRKSGKKENPMSANAQTEPYGEHSFSGVDCTKCDIRKATLYGDKEALQRAVKLWTPTAQEHWGMQTLDPVILKCRGCRVEGGEDIFKGCRHCPIRGCAKAKGLVSCGLCPEWRECGKLSGILAKYSEAKGNLEGDAIAFNK